MSRMVTSVVLELVDRVTRPVRNVQQALSGLSRRAGLDRLASQARAVRAATGDMVSQFGALTRRLAVLGGATAGAVWGMRRLVGGFTEPADAAVKLSRRLSMTYEELQLLVGAAGRMTDMGDGQMTSNLQRFSYRLGQAAAGMGEPAKAMQWAGIALRDSEGNMRSSMDVMMDMADKMASIDSEEMQTRFARAMFGEGGTSMINMLREGREGVQREMDAFARTNQVVPEEAAEEAERYNDNLDEMDGTIRGLRNAVVIGLLPALNEWLETVNPLIQANHDMITGEILRRVSELWSGIQMVAGAVTWAADRVGGFGNLIAVLAVLLAGRFLLSVVRATWAVGAFGVAAMRVAIRILPMLAGGIARLVGSFIALAARAVPAAIAGIRALSLALLTTPIGWVITGITLLAGAVYLIYRNWDAVGPWFRSLWDGIVGWFTQGIGGITRDLLSWSPAGILLRAIDEVFQLFGMRPLSEVGAEWIATLVEGVSAGWQSFTGWVSGRIDALGEAFADFSLAEIGAAWIDSLRAGISERWASLTSWLDERMQSLTGWMPDWAKERLGLGEVGEAPQVGPEAALGPPVAQQGVREMGLREGRTEVGGELRIRIDSEGRPRVQEVRRRGPMDFDVDAGMLGVMP